MTLIRILEYIHEKLMNDTNTMKVSEIIAELFQNNWDKNLFCLLFGGYSISLMRHISHVINFAE